MKDTLMPFEKAKHELLIRREAKTSKKFGNDPNKRTVNELINYGIINIDKFKGPTSHQVTSYVKEIIGVEKAGHSGTLDPHVTGCLPIATGRATRIVQTLLNAGKEYVCLMHIHKDIEEYDIRKAMSLFVGKIKQLPPIKSAVKRQWRYRKIYYIKILDILGRDILFRVGAQAGTYIRKLVHDIGQKIGCGAHMAELRRTKAGPFNENSLVTMHDLKDAFHYYKNDKNEKDIRKYILPIEFAVSHLQKIYVLDTTVDSLCHGANLKLPGISRVEEDIQVDDTAAIMTLKNELICIGSAKMTSKEMLKEKGIAIITHKVFMLPGTYPKQER